MPGIVIGTRENPELNVSNKSYIFGVESNDKGFIHITPFNTCNDTLRQVLQSLISFYRLGS